jgi:hypothetical protein
MRTVTLIFALLGITVFAGCTTLYVPSNNQTPLMKEQGEIHLAGALGANGIGVQAGYAITNNLGIIGGISGRTTEDEEGEMTENHGYGEIGLNYFGFGTENVAGELIGGVGFGSGERGAIQGDYVKPFIQINAGLRTGVFDTGISFRTAYLNFTNLENDAGSGEVSSALFFEPAAFARLGFRHVMFESQLGLAWPMRDASDLAFGYDPMRFSIGVKLLFNTGRSSRAE